MPQLAATTVVLDAVSQQIAATFLRPGAGMRVLADRTLPSGRHLVLADDEAPHRLWLRHAAADGQVAYVLPRGAGMDTRIAATRRFERRLAGGPAGRLPAGVCPTTFQRRRLSLLLGILDAADPATGAPLTTYEIANTLVYRRLAIGRGRDWKSSSERRHTHRLIDDARALMEGGYRALLSPCGSSIGFPAVFE